MANEKSNGKGPAAPAPPNEFRVVLTMNRETLAVTIKSDAPSLDNTLIIVETAKRFLDVQYRISTAVSAQEAIKQHNEELAMRAKLVGQNFRP
jgi:hypothetical protein